MNADRDNSELLLTAFRYVAGELSAAEATEFESALAEDQSARDALADAVVLSEAVAIEEFDRIRPQPMVAAPPCHALPKWGAIAAVCLVVALGFVVLDPSNVTEPTGLAGQPEDLLPVADSGDARSVLSLWRQLGIDDVGRYEFDKFLSEESPVPAPDEVPDWMLSAVVGSGQPPDAPDEMRELMDEPELENL